MPELLHALWLFRYTISINALMRGYRGGYALEYLLRRHKGHFYRTRYPTLTLAE
jgi:hypothetical protein